MHRETARVRSPSDTRGRMIIQNAKGKAKPYQVRQVLEAIAKLKDMGETKTR